MPSLALLLRPLARFLAIDSLKESETPESKNTVLSTCGKIAAVISPDKVFFPGKHFS